MEPERFQSGETTCETQLDNSCRDISSGVNFYQMTTRLDDNQIWLIAVYLGAVINAIFFTMMWRIKELQVHPMNLFMYIMASDSLVLTQYALSLNSCNLHLETLFAATVFFDTSCDS